jgi:hypothetical protein
MENVPDDRPGPDETAPGMSPPPPCGATSVGCADAGDSNSKAEVGNPDKDGEL